MARSSISCSLLLNKPSDPEGFTDTRSAPKAERNSVSRFTIGRLQYFPSKIKRLEADIELGKNGLTLNVFNSKTSLPRSTTKIKGLKLSISNTNWVKREISDEMISLATGNFKKRKRHELSNSRKASLSCDMRLSMISRQWRRVCTSTEKKAGSSSSSKASRRQARRVAGKLLNELSSCDAARIPATFAWLPDKKIWSTHFEFHNIYCMINLLTGGLSKFNHYYTKSNWKSLRKREVKYLD